MPGWPDEVLGGLSLGCARTHLDPPVGPPLLARLAAFAASCRGGLPLLLVTLAGLPLLPSEM
jgi:hypothetical protein